MQQFQNAPKSAPRRHVAFLTFTYNHSPWRSMLTLQSTTSGNFLSWYCLDDLNAWSRCHVMEGPASVFSSISHLGNLHNWVHSFSTCYKVERHVPSTCMCKMAQTSRSTPLMSSWSSLRDFLVWSILTYIVWRCVATTIQWSQIKKVVT